MLKGLTTIRTAIESRVQPGEGVPEVWIASGEVVECQFLTDADDIVEARFHRVPFQLPSGVSVTRERFCQGDVQEDCEFCKHVDDGIRRRVLRWYAWMFVQKLIVPQMPEGVANVTPITRGSRQMFEWDINEPAILRKGEGNQRYIVQQLIQAQERYGSLKGRTFEWLRTGATRNDTTYMLQGVDAADVPDVEIPLDLESIITKELPLRRFPSRSSTGAGDGGRSTPTQAETTQTSDQITSAPASLQSSTATAAEGQEVSALLQMLQGQKGEGNL